MENIIKDAIVELDEIEEQEDWTDYDHKPITEEELQFADDIFNMLQTEVDKASELNEEFTGKQNGNKHFMHHCLGNKTDKKSKKSNVYYDFKDISQYIQHERFVHANIREPDVAVASLLDTELVIHAFKELFKGNKSIVFTSLCGFKNEEGPVVIAIKSFANNVTTNYTQSNTVDFMILTNRLKTITLYPLSIDYLETKFNNIVKKYTTLNVNFKLSEEVTV